MQDKFENLFLVSDLTRCRASHTDTGQIIRVTGFMLLLEGCEQHPGESQDAGYDTDDEYWMQLLEDAENGLASFPERAIFDMWETEKITGSPLNSIWLRGE